MVELLRDMYVICLLFMCMRVHSTLHALYMCCTCIIMYITVRYVQCTCTVYMYCTCTCTVMYMYVQCMYTYSTCTMYVQYTVQSIYSINTCTCTSLCCLPSSIRRPLTSLSNAPGWSKCKTSVTVQLLQAAYGMNVTRVQHVMCMYMYNASQ